MVAMVRALSGGDEADRRVFNLIYHALDALEAREENVKSIEAAFSLKLSILTGYTPRLDFCVSCERDPDGSQLYFAPPLGGVLCDDCYTVTEDAFPLLPKTLAALQDLVARPIKEAAVEKELEESVRRIAYSHVIAHAPGGTVLAIPARRTLHLA
jgi:DNA repair protein RecO